MTTLTETEPPFRYVIVLVLIAISIGLLVHFFMTFLSMDRAMEAYDLEKETARLASNLFFAKMTANAQLTVALIGGAWTLFTLGGLRITITGRSSMMCFVLANCSLALSLLAYAFGYDFIVSRVFYHSAFDIDASFISNVNISQQFLFLNGLLDMVCALMFGRRMQ